MKFLNVNEIIKRGYSIIFNSVEGKWFMAFLVFEMLLTGMASLTSYEKESGSADEIPVLNETDTKSAEITRRMEKDAYNIKDPHYEEKVKAVYSVIASSTKTYGKMPEDVPISAENIVKCCVELGFDIPLLLAQGHWESHFGADPRARRCQTSKSIFSVGLCDDGKTRVSYDSFDDSVPAYIKLMKDKYLTESKSVTDLLSPGGFVNTNNERYASGPDYERNIMLKRNKILRQHPVLGS